MSCLMYRLVWASISSLSKNNQNDIVDALSTLQKTLLVLINSTSKITLPEKKTIPNNQTDKLKKNYFKTSLKFVPVFAPRSTSQKPQN